MRKGTGKNKVSNQSGRAGSQRVVPLRKSRVGLQRKLSHHAVWHGYTGRIRVEIEASGDCQSSGCARCPDEADDCVEIAQWPSPPVDADVSDQPMFDLVPLAGPGW